MSYGYNINKGGETKVKKDKRRFQSASRVDSSLKSTTDGFLPSGGFYARVHNCNFI